MSAYQPPGRQERQVIFARAATTFFNSLDAYVGAECIKLGQFPSLTDKNLLEFKQGVEARRNESYQKFLSTLKDEARVASLMLNKDPQLQEVLGPAPQAYAHQAYEQGSRVLRLRVLRESVIEAPQTADPQLAFWKVIEGYADSYNQRRSTTRIHTRTDPRGEFYETHFNDNTKDAQELAYFGLLPLLDKEIRQRVPVNLSAVQPKAYILLGRQLIKAIGQLIVQDEHTAKERLQRIREEAIVRMSRSERTSRMLDTRQLDLENLLRSSAAGE